MSEVLQSQIQSEMPESDGFDTCLDGSTAPILKFTNDHRWVLRDGTEISSTREFIVVAVRRHIVKWPTGGGRPEVTPLKPQEPVPDIEELNASVPVEEWRPDPGGKLKGPYEFQYEAQLIDRITMDAYRFPTATAGGYQACGNLIQKTQRKRKLEGAAFMPTKFGGRQRPDLRVVRFERLGDGGGEALPAPTTVPALPNPTPIAAALDKFANNEKPTEPKSPSGPPVVAETLKEEMQDEIPF